MANSGGTFKFKKTFATLLKDPKLWRLTVQALIEISYNFLYEDVGLSGKDKKEIGKFERFLTRLAARGKAIKNLTKKCDPISRNQKAIQTLLSPLTKNTFEHLTNNDSV